MHAFVCVCVHVLSALQHFATLQKTIKGAVCLLFHVHASFILVIEVIYIVDGD